MGGHWPARRHDLDWIRVAAVATVVLYHFGPLYADFPAPDGADLPLPGLALFEAATHPWRMPLLFLVSGVVSRHLLAGEASPREFLRARLVRLVPPLLLGLALIVPVQCYLAWTARVGPMPFWLFWSSYVNLDDWLQIRGALDLQAASGHLWFVLYLALYVFAAGLVAWFAPTGVARLTAAVDSAPAAVILIGPLAFLIAMRAWWMPHHLDVAGRMDDLYRHIVFGFLFLLGFLAAPAGTFWRRLVAWRWLSLSLALAAGAVVGALALTAGRGDLGLAEHAHPGLRAVRPVLVWCSICAALGFARGLRGGAVLAYLTPAVMTVYLVHPVVIEVARIALGPEPSRLGAPLVLALVYAACLGVHEVVRRVAWLRFWFGMARPSRRPRRDPLTVPSVLPVAEPALGGA